MCPVTETNTICGDTAGAGTGVGSVSRTGKPSEMRCASVTVKHACTTRAKARSSAVNASFRTFFSFVVTVVRVAGFPCVASDVE